MLDPDKAKLELEQSRGERYAEVYNEYIAPFIEEKQRILFEAFQATPVSNVEGLKDIKLQSTALVALGAHFQQFIDSGKLAKAQLEK